MTTKRLTEGNPLKLILAFMLPVFMGNLIQVIYNLTDAYVVGKYIGYNALGEIGATTSIIFMIMSFAIALTQGFAVVTAQKFGARQHSLVRKSYATSIILGIISAIILTLITAPNSYEILLYLRTPKELIAGANEYLFIIFLGLFAPIFFNIATNVLRALGDSKTPILFFAISAILNIILDLIFVLKFGFGLSMVAFATVLSQFISAVFCFLIIFLKYDILHLNLSDWVLSKPLTYKHLKIGVPMAIGISILTFGKIILQFVLNEFGANAVVAFSIGVRIDNIVYQIYLALGITMANYSAQNYGAKNKERIKEGASLSMAIVLIVSVLSIVILYLFADEIVALFMNEPNAEIIEMACTYLHTIMFFLFFLGTLLVYRNLLQGIGSVGFPVAAGVCELIVRSLSAVILAKYFSYQGVCFATPLAWLVGAIILFIGYRINSAKKLKEN